METYASAHIDQGATVGKDCRITGRAPVKPDIDVPDATVLAADPPKHAENGDGLERLTADTIHDGHRIPERGTGTGRHTTMTEPRAARQASRHDPTAGWDSAENADWGSNTGREPEPDTDCVWNGLMSRAGAYLTIAPDERYPGLPTPARTGTGKTPGPRTERTRRRRPDTRGQPGARPRSRSRAPTTPDEPDGSEPKHLVKAKTKPTPAPRTRSVGRRAKQPPRRSTRQGADGPQRARIETSAGTCPRARSPGPRHNRDRQTTAGRSRRRGHEGNESCG